MSTETSPQQAPVTAADHEAHQKEHPSDWVYIQVAIWLGIITALEVSTYFWDDWFGFDASATGVAVALILMMIIKFAGVCLWFMHLRYDHPLFRRVFVFGLLLAVAVYLIAMTALEFWSSTSASGA